MTEGDKLEVIEGTSWVYYLVPSTSGGYRLEIAGEVEFDFYYLKGVA